MEILGLSELLKGIAASEPMEQRSFPAAEVSGYGRQCFSSICDLL
jgi:hypothetical protein